MPVLIIFARGLLRSIDRQECFTLAVRVSRSTRSQIGRTQSKFKISTAIAPDRVKSQHLPADDLIC
ncbi:hypothetical protein QUB76_20115 [Microcoleus sp. D2B6]|uniref:hypothetical protein n=1 Tax=unclassified Microcoleus TaxID=2642155 RepID=UPI002FD71F2B